MMSHAIYDTSGLPVERMPIGVLAPGTHALQSIKIKNVGTETAPWVSLVVFLKDGATTGTAAQGSEIVAGGYLQARVSGDVTWVPLKDGICADVLPITPPAPAATVTIELRMVVPSGATFGPAEFQPRLTTGVN